MSDELSKNHTQMSVDKGGEHQSPKKLTDSEEKLLEETCEGLSSPILPEESLSDKRVEYRREIYERAIYFEEDVKEFIRKLKRSLPTTECKINPTWLRNKIDKLAGEDLK